MTFVEWYRKYYPTLPKDPFARECTKAAWDQQQAKVEALEGALWEIADGKHSDNNLTAMHFARLKLADVS